MADRKKTPELSAGLLAVKGSAAPAVDAQPRAAEPTAPAAPALEVTGEPEVVKTEANDAPLNFRVSPTFKREFRTYAAQHDLKLNELLRLCFEAYRSKEDR